MFLQSVLKSSPSLLSIPTPARATGSSIKSRANSESENTVLTVAVEIYLQWAYFEAMTFVRQYADLIEQLQVYLQTQTSTVGECLLLVETQLQSTSTTVSTSKK